MSVTRRNFLEELIAAGLLTGAVSTAGFSRTAVESLLGSEPDMQEPKGSGLQGTQGTGSGAHEFWDNFFESGLKSGGPKPPLDAQDRSVQYLHYHETNGLRYVNDIKPDELLDYEGDVMISAALGQFRLGTDDETVLHQIKSSHLRIEFHQTKSFMNVLAPMAWAALAVFAHDKPGKLPSLDALGYKAPNYVNGIQKVLLPGGTGKFAVNVYPVKPESTLHKILKIVVPLAMQAAPVLNLPAISVPVLKTITELYLGPKSEESHGKPLLNSYLSQWIATKQALSDPDLEVQTFPLVSGNYVMVPQAHVTELKKAMPTLVWQQGYLVSKDASASDSLATRAEQVIPGVTYASMRLSVTKMPTGAAAPKTNGAESESGSTAETKSKSPSATTTKPTTGTGKPGTTPPRKKP